jgi:Na+-translocating ferredoxin:NAD+ oxidoreductase RnfE subunit
MSAPARATQGALDYHEGIVAAHAEADAMKLVTLLKSVAWGASAGVALLTALPVFGAVGTLTGAGAVVGSVVGGMAGLLDTLRARRP